MKSGIVLLSVNPCRTEFAEMLVLTDEGCGGQEGTSVSLGGLGVLAVFSPPRPCAVVLIIPFHPVEKFDSACHGRVGRARNQSVLELRHG